VEWAGPGPVVRTFSPNDRVKDYMCGHSDALLIQMSGIWTTSAHGEARNPLRPPRGCDGTFVACVSMGVG